ncbi:MAG: hypothetical protein IKO35_03180, partial [Elusimicrobiaceae bacterium]|nr:hypothetical protein [Elusimicrobiaceae bacterium]
FWSNTNNTCYMTEAARCTAHGMNMVEDEGESFCGYENTRNKTVKEGGKCVATNNINAGGCMGATIEAGGKCIANSESYEGCISLTVNGGTCIAEENPNPSFSSWPCRGTFEDGSKCVANVARACTGTYRTGSCCEGDFCPSYAPSCQD